MAVTEAPLFEPEVAPDVRGPTAALPVTILALGIASLVVIAVGVLFSQVNYAFSDRVMTQYCLDQQISPEDNGGIGVCNIIEALQDPTTSGGLYLGIGLGAAAVILGASTYRRMDSKRKRDHAITGAVLGSQGIVLAIGILWFRSVSPGLFAKHFLNFADLHGYGAAFLRGILGSDGRMFAVCKVLWPSIKFSSEELIPGGGAVSAHAANDASLDAILEALAKVERAREAFFRTFSGLDIEIHGSERDHVSEALGHGACRQQGHRSDLTASNRAGRAAKMRPCRLGIGYSPGPTQSETCCGS